MSVASWGGCGGGIMRVESEHLCYRQEEQEETGSGDDVGDWGGEGEVGGQGRITVEARLPARVEHGQP